MAQAGTDPLKDKSEPEETMVLTGKHMSRRTALKGLGVTVALPLFDSMMPARSSGVRTIIGKGLS